MKPFRALVFLAALPLLTDSLAIAQSRIAELDCLIKPEMLIDISSSTGGVLDRVLVDKGDAITAGQVLAELESSIESARVEIARHEADMANIIQSKQIQLDFAKRKEKRIAELLGGTALSVQEYDDAQTGVLIAKSELLQAQLDQRRNFLRLQQAQAELEQRTVRSPVNGLVVERNLQPGESVNKEPILQIAKVDPLVIEAIAPYELFGKVSPGMKVDVVSDVPAGVRVKTAVTHVDTIIDPASGSFSIRIMQPNPDNRLISGARCVMLFPATF